MDTAFLSLMERCVFHPYTVPPPSSLLPSFSFSFSSSPPSPHHPVAAGASPHPTHHSDPTEELLMIIGIFSHFFALETTLAERQFFRALAKLIGRRAARMSACGIAAIVSKMGYLEEGCSVGADGSLYNVSFSLFF